MTTEERRKAIERMHDRRDLFDLACSVVGIIIFMGGIILACFAV